MSPPIARLAARLRLLALVAVGAGFAASCGSTPAAPAPDASSLVDASSPVDASAVDASPVDASPAVDASRPVDASPPVDASDGAKVCSATGLLDVDARREGRYRGVQIAPAEVNAQLIDVCQGSLAPVRGVGVVRLNPSTGASFYVRVDPIVPGYYPSASEIWTFDYPSLRADMVVSLVSKGGVDPQVLYSPVPDPFAGVWNPSKAHFVVDLNPVGNCGTAGYRLTVVGHPEAKIAYSDGPFVPEPTLEETGSEGGAFAFISNVDPGPGTLEITGRHGGCRVAPPNLPVPVNSGKYPIIAGTATEIALVSTPE